MKQILRQALYIVACVLASLISFSQTSWTGATSVNWATASNWTAGVPTATVDAVVGNASFTGPYQPTISATATCKSLTIGGSVSSTLTISRTVTVAGNVTLNNNGSIINGSASISLTGNWLNSGSYSTTSTSARVIFAGTVQSIGGSNTTTFRRVTINAGSTVTLLNNIISSGSSSYINISGTLNPNQSPTYTATAATVTVNNNGVLRVMASAFTGNYSFTALTLSAGSIVDYGATAVNQTVSSTYTYSTLRISGSGIKSLAANLPLLRATSSGVGNIQVQAGTFELGAFTAARGTAFAGGTITVSNDAGLKIGGTNSFPAGYNTTTLGLTSTVDYNGAAQVVAAKTYGNLTLSSSGGPVVKTMPGTAFTVAGNLSSVVGSGTAVSFTAASNLSVTGNVNIGLGTTFNGGTFSHTITGNWVVNGTFTGAMSTVILRGANTTISGNGTHNFYNLTVTGSGVNAVASISLNIAGDFGTSGTGAFLQASPGGLTMTGATKTISGIGITLNDLTASGTITTTSSFTLQGSLTVSGSLTATTGTISMTGAGKNISGAGGISFSALAVSGTVTTASTFTVASALAVTGGFTATAGTATFTGTATVSGTPNLYNVTENGSSLVLASNAVLGIAANFSFTSGTLNATTNVPNAVHYNGTITQNVPAQTYNNLTLSNGSTKTAAGAITVNNAFALNSATTFAAGGFTHTLLGHFVNNGTFNAGSGTVSFAGAANTTITGVTTFNNLTVNKMSSANNLSLLSNITVSTVNMTTGSLLTGSSGITITTTRTGTGIILGSITRTHLFITGTSYAFESPENTITFSTMLGVTSITVYVASAPVADFPFGGAINRYYNITIPAGTYNARLRLHYEMAELGGNDEALMQLWRYNGTAWTASGKTANSTGSNWVENNGITNLNNRWTCTDDGSVLVWNGSVSSDWANASNWSLVQGTFSGAPGSTDIAEIGQLAFTHQPAVSSTVMVKGILFGSTQAVNLSVNAGGTLTATGNVGGTWMASQTHTITAGAQTINVNGDLILSDGTTGRAINLSLSTGTVNVARNLVQSGGASIVFSSAGTLNVGGDFAYTSGTFTPSTGTVRYNGLMAQMAAGIAYYNLVVNKTTGVATLPGGTSISGGLTITSGDAGLGDHVMVAGSVQIASGGRLSAGDKTLQVGSDWTTSGIFDAGTGTVVLNGGSSQTISAGSFNNITINKASGTAALGGNVAIGGNASVLAGTLNLAAYSFNRSSPGGTFTVADGAVLELAGAANFPSLYAMYNLADASTVRYNGTVAQLVTGVTYGHLIFSNSGIKTLAASVSADGNLTINSGAQVSAASHSIALGGNWINNGTFAPGTGEVLLNGAAKTVSGNTAFNELTVNGSYVVTGSNITYNGHLLVAAAGSYQAGNGVATINGDLTNQGSLTSNGTTTFTGTTLQTLRLINALVSTSTGIVNFNGSVSPVLNSTSTPTFATLNINNTAGVNPSVDWLMLGPFTVSSGASFHGGTSTHRFSHAFTNNGTVTSNGGIVFNPALDITIKLSGSNFSSTGTVEFGGTGQLTITNTPTALEDVIVSNTAAAGIAPALGWNIGGKFSIQANSIFNASSHSYTVAGDIESNGTLNGGSSTFTMTSPAGTLTGSPATTFNHFVVAGDVTAASDFNVAGNFTNNGVYDGTIGAVIMTGATNATIGGSTSPSTIAQLTVNKAPLATVSAAVDISSVTNLTVAGGTFFTSTHAINQNAAGGIMIVAANATLRLGGTNTLPAFTGYGLDEASIVDYAGTVQTVSNIADYGHLRISAAGNKTASNFLPLTVRGDFNLSAGNFIAGNNNHDFAGHWTMTGGTFDATASNIRFNGFNDQTITTLAPFNNLTVNKPIGLLLLGSDVDVNATLALTFGKMDINNHNLTIIAGGFITGATPARYIIAEGSGHLQQQVVVGTPKAFPIGSTNYYTPATVTLASGSTADIFRARMMTAVYRNGTTGAQIFSGVTNATWVINEAVTGGSTATITMQWPAALELPGFYRNFCMPTRYVGPEWNHSPATVAASGSNPYAVSRGNFTAFGLFTVAMEDVLPVTWVSVSGRADGKRNHISWLVASERGSSHYVVETSADGRLFTGLGKVSSAMATGGNGEYKFIHEAVTGAVNYYRIKQVDVDGRYSYSVVIRIAGTDAAERFAFGPNPVQNKGVLTIQSASARKQELVIYSSAGSLIWKQTVMLQPGVHAVPVDLSRQPAGIYVLQLTDEAGAKQLLRVMKAN